MARDFESDVPVNEMDLVVDLLPSNETFDRSDVERRREEAIERIATLRESQS